MTRQAPGWTPGAHPSSMPTAPALPMAESRAGAATTIATTATAARSALSHHRAREAGLLAAPRRWGAAMRRVEYAIAVGDARKGVMGDARKGVTGVAAIDGIWG